MTAVVVAGQRAMEARAENDEKEGKHAAGDLVENRLVHVPSLQMLAGDRRRVDEHQPGGE